MIESLRDLLGRALARAGLEATSDAFRVAEAWEEAVGPTVAARARPAGLERGELLVAAPDAVWRQELALLAPDIKQKINRALGAEVVQRVRIVGGSAGPGPVAGDRDRRRRG
ncbi:MAG: DciA family protein [Alphaproteobacteria bacterium]